MANPSPSTTCHAFADGVVEGCDVDVCPRTQAPDAQIAMTIVRNPMRLGIT